jgi:glucose-6-phosphate 1-dehydrogenase
VIFGAAGDLTKRKLIPSLYHLKKGNLLPDDFAVVGVARAEMNDEEFRKRLGDDLHEFASDQIDQDAWRWLKERLYYLSGDFDDDQTYVRLKEQLSKVDAERNTRGNYLFYLATAPDYFALVVEKLGSAGLATADENHWRRFVIEKPFGRDLDSARKLNQALKQILEENQI